MKIPRLITATAAVAGVAAGLVALAPAASAAPAYTCPGSFVSVTADWLKVHTTPGVNTSVVGQLPHGARYCLLDNKFPTKDGYAWAHGYGYNGTHKLTGYAVTKYLSFP